MTTTVPISSHGLQLLTELARSSGTAMNDLLDQALESFRRQRFLEETNAAYAELAGDREAWKAYREELQSLDGTLADGLQNLEP